MVQLVTAINRDPFGGRQVVTCWSCHRGRERPVLTPTLDAGYGEPIFEFDDMLTSAPGVPTVDSVALPSTHAYSIGTSLREVPAPPPAFTAGVMRRIGHEHWRAERVFDIGFNVAIAAGVLLVLAGGAGLAWSLGLLTISVDWTALARVAGGNLGEQVVPQIQTIGIAAILLTMTLALWWWAEADTSM